MAVTPSTDINKYDISDDTSAVSPAYAAGLFLAMLKEYGGNIPVVPDGNDSVIGVVFTSAFDKQGVVLKHINENFEEIQKPDTGWFNEHPAYKFEDRMDGVNYMVRVPIAFWKRGRVPEGKPNAGQRYFLISPTEREGFKASRAFMKDGVRQDAFLYAKYRGSHQNGRIVSQPNKPHASSKGDTGHTNGRSFTEQQQMCEANGSGYHMSTVFEYHEILMRAVIEMGTFDLYPESVRQDKSKNIYRLIEEMAYDGYTNTATRDNATYCEWRDALRAQQQMSSGAQNYLEIWDAQGRRTWTATHHKCLNSGISGYITELDDETGLDEIVMAAQTRSTSTPVSANDIALIPDGQYTTSASTSHPYVAHSHFSAGNAYGGAFHLGVSNSPSSAYAHDGSRPAKV